MYENIYYDPEKFGVETVGEISWYDASYEFDLTTVWKKTRGVYYLASDSGCSCPSPFEFFTSVEDLEGPYNKTQLKDALDRLINERKPSGPYSYTHSEAELRKQARSILDQLK